jgi:hypothetical protein
MAEERTPRRQGHHACSFLGWATRPGTAERLFGPACCTSPANRHTTNEGRIVQSVRRRGRIPIRTEPGSTAPIPGRMAFKSIGRALLPSCQMSKRCRTACPDTLAPWPRSDTAPNEKITMLPHDAELDDHPLTVRFEKSPCETRTDIPG